MRTVGLVWELGYMIAIPAFVFGFAGAYLDKWFGTSPLFVLCGLVVAFGSSAYAVYHLVQRITRP